MSMARVRKAGVFAVLLALFLGLAVLVFQEPLTDWVSILRTGWGRMEYVAAAVNEKDEIYALGREGNRLTVLRGGQDGRRLDRWELMPGQLPERFRLGAFYPDIQDTVYLGIYELDGEDNARALLLYRVSNRGKTAELLLRQDCSGRTVPEQMNSVRLSGFARQEGTVSFALLAEGRATVYRTVKDGAGLQEGDSYPAGDTGAALVLADGSLIQGGAGCLLHNETTYPADGRIRTNFRQAGAVIYGIDRSSLEVLYTDLTALDRCRTVMSLEKEDYDLDGLTDWALTSTGSALLLLDGRRLLLDRGSTVADLTRMLYRSAPQCALLLGALLLAVLALTFLVWYPVCQWRQAQIPILLRWGGLLTAAAVLLTAAAARWVLWPQLRAGAVRELDRFTGGVTALAMQNTPLDSETLSDAITGGLFRAEHCRDAAVSLYEKVEDRWVLRQSGVGETPGVQAVVTAGFDRSLALTAQEQGRASGELVRDGQPRFLQYWYRDGLLLAVDVGGESLLLQAEQNHQETVRAAALGAVVLLGILLAALAWISAGLRQLTRGMERLCAGESGVEVALSSGDELEGLGRAFNSLSRTVEDLELHRQELARSYLRFVPERILALLGKQSLAEVDKTTFVSKYMSAMTVWFTYPASVYEHSGRELFDDLNRIIERTAPIIARKGGTVFNFAYNGYDAVFEGEPAEMVSTAVAVQQEILSFNRERELAGRPQVKLRIALDQGSMMIGVVGDETQMEPTAISSSFAALRRLIRLCETLDANILCTEAVVSAARECASRYMGKCPVGESRIRTYEIYGGDPYSLRMVKERTAGRFSQGVYALYSRDFQGAKRIFLDLLHDSIEDGGARYYLYLADQLEKDPDREIGLEQEERSPAS